LGKAKQESDECAFVIIVLLSTHRSNRISRAINAIHRIISLRDYPYTENYIMEYRGLINTLGFGASVAWLCDMPFFSPAAVGFTALSGRAGSTGNEVRIRNNSSPVGRAINCCS
jgi:hypothetical protein